MLEVINNKYTIHKILGKVKMVLDILSIYKYILFIAQ